jgi:hypothetical protein
MLLPGQSTNVVLIFDQFSSMDPEEKERALTAWQKRWDFFLEYATKEGQDFLTQFKSEVPEPQL